MFADVTSANIVGYQNKEIPTDAWSAHCATFQKIDKTQMKLGDIKANDVFYLSSLQLVDENGTTKKVRSEVFGDPADDYMVDGIFYWYPEEYLVGDMTEEGWYLYESEEKFECMNHIDLSFGEGFCIYGQDDGAEVRFAGQVASADDLTFEVVNEIWNSFGNCTPVDITLGQVKANDVFYMSSLQLVNDEGTTLKVRSEVFGDPADDYLVDGIFYWYPQEYLVGDMTEEGWYLFESEEKFDCMNHIQIGAGEGFVVYGQDDGATLTIPDPLTKAE